jgi:hypothetical protein
VFLSFFCDEESGQSVALKSLIIVNNIKSAYCKLPYLRKECAMIITQLPVKKK